MHNIVTFIICVSFAVLSMADVMKVERRKPLTANVGVVSVGLDTYWKQCPGLLEDLMKKEDVFVDKLNAHSCASGRLKVRLTTSRSASATMPPKSRNSAAHSESKL
jgi:hypothetical protein